MANAAAVQVLSSFSEPNDYSFNRELILQSYFVLRAALPSLRANLGGCMKKTTRLDDPSSFLPPLGTPRTRLHRSGVLQTTHGPYRCIVNNISDGGANVSVDATASADKPLTVGAKVSLTIAGLGYFQGQIVWQNGTTCGMRFAEGERASLDGLVVRESGRQIERPGSSLYRDDPVESTTDDFRVRRNVGR